LDAKLNGDVAEQAAILHALKRGWGVLKPVGDRLTYDLVFDIEGSLVKFQVKFAWFDEPSGNYVLHMMIDILIPVPIIKKKEFKLGIRLATYRLEEIAEITINTRKKICLGN